MTMSRQDLLALTRELPIPTPWDRDAFIGNIAAMRGRPIRLLPGDTTDPTVAGSAVWLTRADEDVIIHDPGLPDDHMDQTVCHGVAHILLGHDSAPTATDNPHASANLGALLPDINAKAVRTVLGGTGFGAPFDANQEGDAEALAQMILRTAR